MSGYTRINLLMFISHHSQFWVNTNMASLTPGLLHSRIDSRGTDDRRERSAIEYVPILWDHRRLHG